MRVLNNSVRTLPQSVLKIGGFLGSVGRLSQQPTSGLYDFFVCLCVCLHLKNMNAKPAALQGFTMILLFLKLQPDLNLWMHATQIRHT